MNSPVLIPMFADDPLSSVWLDTNDLDNAERLKRLAKGLLLWVEDMGWAAYDGKRWSTRDGDRRATELAHAVARHVDREAAALNALADDEDKLEAAFGWKVSREMAEDQVKRLRAWSVKSGDASRTSAMLVQARTLLAARREDFDKDPLALNLQNGTLRFFKDGPPSPDPSQDGKKIQKWSYRVDPHEPTDLLMQISTFSYDKVADCREWKERLALIQPDPAQRRLLRALYGYILTGLISEQKWWIHQGRGGDGKSVTNMVIAALMGDYYRHAGIETFLQGAQKSGSDHSSDLARLMGDIRFVSCDEPPPQATWSGSRLKQVTGGTITCRPLRKEEVEYVARWKLIIEVNPLPKVPSDDDGFWRRCRLVPWEYQFDRGGEKSEPMEIMIERLTAEGSGILNWMIRGCLWWLQERRMPESAKSTEMYDAYRATASPFGQWLLERADTSDPEAETGATVLYKDFEDFCKGTLGLEKAPTQTFFGNKLRDRHHHTKKCAYTGNTLRKGIKLRTDDLASGGGQAPRDGAGGRAASPSQMSVDEEEDRPF